MATTTFQIDGTTGSAFTALPGIRPRPVAVWAEGSDGKRRPTDRQETDADGIPLWELDVAAQTISWGSPGAEIVTLRWAEAGTPTSLPGVLA